MLEVDGYEQRERLDEVRAKRDEALVKKQLAALGAAAKAGDNVMPATMDAVEAYATVGEVCTVFKEVFGTYREPVRF